MSHGRTISEGKNEVNLRKYPFLIHEQKKEHPENWSLHLHKYFKSFIPCIYLRNI